MKFITRSWFLRINTVHLQLLLLLLLLFYYYYSSTALCWALTTFSVSWSYTQSVGLLGREISLSQDLYLHTEQHEHRINVHNTDIHALSGIRTHDPRVQASEDSSYLRPRGHCDRQFISNIIKKFVFHLILNFIRWINMNDIVFKLPVALIYCFTHIFPP
jgi:hypothetical protein